MAVAVKNAPEAPPQQRLDPVAIGSLMGSVYVLISLAVVFYAVPRLWGVAITPLMGEALSFVDAALRLLAVLGAGAGLVIFGQRLVGTSQPVGWRAGVFSCLVAIVVLGVFTLSLGLLLERSLGEQNRVVSVLTTVVVGLALFGLAGRALFGARAKKWLVQIEEQGWFTSTGYKRTQGQKVRRGTILGVLVLAGSGIYTLMSHKALEFGLPDANHWAVPIPFTEGLAITLLPDVRFTLPIVLAVASLWFAYRVVNYPVFADFLIATEAEMNKVSWTTRKRLFQDTVVVLTTVFLLTIFIFLVDVLWGWGLSGVGVLQVPEIQKQERQQIEF